MRSIFFILVSSTLLITTLQAGEHPDREVSPSLGAYGFAVQGIDGTEVDLAAYKGRVTLIVNVATKCGFTPQLEGLDRLYRHFREDGFAVLGFPANNFMNQAPGSDEEIHTFCATTYGVTFPLFAKISVKGDDRHALYEYLTSKETNPDSGGEITWNFNKFLIGRDGTILDRFGSGAKPESPEIVQAIQEALKR